MSCTFPNTAWEIVDSKTGEVSIVFKSMPSGFYFKLLRELKLPCGQCAHCRKGRAREKAIRSMHEASLHGENSFITLTYEDSYLPSDGSLKIEHFQKFMKRLRSRLSDKVKVFYCGEYGPKLKRPHFHAIVFGFGFPDKIIWKEENDVRWYRSKFLEEVWQFGFSLIGEVTFASAAYVASYVQKKITGKIASKYYQGLSPEFSHWSNGIGRGWLKKWVKDVYPSDEIIMNGFQFSPPRYYDKIFQTMKPQLLEKIKARRVIRAEKFASEQTLPRRKVRDKHLRLENAKKKRSYEDGTN